MKKLFKLMSILLAFTLYSCNNESKDSYQTLSSDSIIDSTLKEEELEMIINMNINGHTLSATLEDNASGKAFYELIKQGLTLNLSEYGGFEKVGPIGKKLPSNDTTIHTKPGDLILYASNQFSLMYGTNTWSYSKLGEINHLEEIELTAILGKGSVTISFSIA